MVVGTTLMSPILFLQPKCKVKGGRGFNLESRHTNGQVKCATIQLEKVFQDHIMPLFSAGKTFPLLTPNYKFGIKSVTHIAYISSIAFDQTKIICGQLAGR